MRQILFRGKRIDNDEWTEGYLFKIWNRTFLLWGMTGDVPNMVEVKPETVGEYTGLTDKNDKKIFEGDIVKFVYNGNTGVYQVVYDISELDFKVTNGKEKYENNFQYLTCCEEIEAISNVYDNTEAYND